MLIGVFWGYGKNNIIKHLQENLKLEVVKTANVNKYGRSIGKLRLTNNSEYDITDIYILIEHFDKNKKSVNTDTEFIYDIIRKNGYREFSWSTSNCSKCWSQKFQINYTKEHY